MAERYCVIMAGGIGSRFWPLSKKECPKQFLDILGTGKTFIRATFERFLPLVKAENFVVVTNKAYKGLVMEQLPELKEEQVLCEPMRRNTAPCIAYATYHIMARSKDATIIVSPSDHLVTAEGEFARVIESAIEYAEKDKQALMTIGIRPTRAETGYGYIEVNEQKEGINKVEAFKEKPNKEVAQQFYASGRHYWNSGIFVWSAEAIKEAMEEYLPKVVEVFEKGREMFGTEREQEYVERCFGECEDISIDYGVMERSRHCHTISGDFGWSDIGTWGSLYEHTAHDKEGNSVVGGKVKMVESKNNVVNIESGIEAVIEGMEGYLVAYRGGSLLVCRLEDEQRIKEWQFD